MNYKKQYFLIIIICHLTSLVESAKILGVFPTPSISHQVAFRPLMKELAKRGHEVTVITTDPEFDPETAPDNLTEIDLHKMSYDFHKTEILTRLEDKTKNLDILKVLHDTMNDLLEKQLNSSDVQKILHGKDEIDLVIVEACYMSAAIAVGYWFNAPIIQISSLGGFFPLYRAFGVPTHPVIYPDILNNVLNSHSVLDKIRSIYFEYQLYNVLAKGREDGRVARIFGEKMPSSQELVKLPVLLLANVHHVWIQNRPLPPSVVLIGGIHLEPPNELPLVLKKYLDSSKNGVIYISFGTNVDPTKFKMEQIQVFCKVFRKLPYDVIWKWDEETLPGKPDNVVISKWLPQADLLRHPKIKLFITQAGMQSTDEAIIAGVPMIAFPMHGDQYYNARLFEQLGIGVKMEFLSITESVLEDAIVKVLNNQSYYDAIRRLNGTLYDQPQSPLECAVWWTEYVLRHGGARHLRAHMADVTGTQYLMLDVVAVLLSITLLTFYTMYQILNQIRRVLQPPRKFKEL